MAVDASYNTLQPYITQYGPNGVLLWQLSCDKTDFNDVRVNIPKKNLNNIWSRYPDCDIILNQVVCIWTPTTSGAGITATIRVYPYYQVSPVLQDVHTIDSFISLATPTRSIWSGSIVVTHWQDQVWPSTLAILSFNLPAGAVTTLDDVSFLLQGSLYPRPESPDRNVPMPVDVKSVQFLKRSARTGVI